jgi:hypothetical protein
MHDGLSAVVLFNIVTTVEAVEPSFVVETPKIMRSVCAEFNQWDGFDSVGSSSERNTKTHDANVRTILRGRGK